MKSLLEQASHFYGWLKNKPGFIRIDDGKKYPDINLVLENTQAWLSFCKQSKVVKSSYTDEKTNLQYLAMSIHQQGGLMDEYYNTISKEHPDYNAIMEEKKALTNKLNEVKTQILQKAEQDFNQEKLAQQAVKVKCKSDGVNRDIQIRFANNDMRAAFIKKMKEFIQEKNININCDEVFKTPSDGILYITDEIGHEDTIYFSDDQVMAPYFQNQMLNAKFSDLLGISSNVAISSKPWEFKKSTSSEEAISVVTGKLQPDVLLTAFQDSKPEGKNVNIIICPEASEERDIKIRFASTDAMDAFIAEMKEAGKEANINIDAILTILPNGVLRINPKESTSLGVDPYIQVSAMTPYIYTSFIAFGNKVVAEKFKRLLNMDDQICTFNSGGILYISSDNEHDIIKTNYTFDSPALDAKEQEELRKRAKQLIKGIYDRTTDCEGFTKVIYAAIQRAHMEFDDISKTEFDKVIKNAFDTKEQKPQSVLEALWSIIDSILSLFGKGTYAVFIDNLSQGIETKLSGTFGRKYTEAYMAQLEQDDKANLHR